MKPFFYIILLVLFISCDYYGEYHYDVKNELSRQVMVLTEQDTLFIASGNQLRILTTGSGNIGRNDDPFDIFEDELTDFYVLEVYVDDTLIEKDFRQRSYWEFQMNGNQSSTYLLRISENILE